MIEFTARDFDELCQADVVRAEILALVAVEGGDRFEPGTLFRRRPGGARVRRMFDDLCAALTTVGALRAKLG